MSLTLLLLDSIKQLLGMHQFEELHASLDLFCHCERFRYGSQTEEIPEEMGVAGFPIDVEDLVEGEMTCSYKQIKNKPTINGLYYDRQCFLMDIKIIRKETRFFPKSPTKKNPSCERKREK
eukprot:TRINITY_DN10879_c1_g1_i3.p1 TRINITY_DN10879_c1_g1~~TRINITY_DN10879_c1_g1_i3.p1  ORF type:complete len:121 (-),score=15.03 TRINITY_DN10879_c1_g1_i3:136-498(-)